MTLKSSVELSIFGGLERQIWVYFKVGQDEEEEPKFKKSCVFLTVEYSQGYSNSKVIEGINVPMKEKYRVSMCKEKLNKVLKCNVKLQDTKV